MKRWALLAAVALALTGCTESMCESTTDSLVLPAAY